MLIRELQSGYNSYIAYILKRVRNQFPIPNTEMANSFRLKIIVVGKNYIQFRIEMGGREGGGGNLLLLLVGFHRLKS